jgi:hypothetical protein
MKKVTSFVVSFLFMTAIYGQIDFNAEFGKFEHEMKKVRELLQPFKSQFTQEQISLLFTDKAKSAIQLSKDQEKTFVEINAGFVQMRSIFSDLVTNLYGPAKFDKIDFQKRLVKYYGSSVGPDCIGCMAGCYAVYNTCIAAGVHPLLCHADLDMCLYINCVPIC